MRRYLPKRLQELPLQDMRRDATKRMRALLPAPKPEGVPVVQQERVLLPYERYRQNKLLKLLKLEMVAGKSILEVGCGEGELLLLMLGKKPKSLNGVDDERPLVDTARKRLRGKEVDIYHTRQLNRLPYPDGAFDLVIMLHELQAINDEEAVFKMVKELCRLSKKRVMLLEDTSEKPVKEEGYMRRPVKYYEELFKKQHFNLTKTEALDVVASRSTLRWFSHPGNTARWLLTPLMWAIGMPRSWYQRPAPIEEQPVTGFSLFMQKLLLPFTSWFDDVFRATGGATVMFFEEEKLYNRLAPFGAKDAIWEGWRESTSLENPFKNMDKKGQDKKHKKKRH